jgi:hypothetical protein
MLTEINHSTTQPYMPNVSLYQGISVSINGITVPAHQTTQFSTSTPVAFC